MPSGASEPIATPTTASREHPVAVEHERLAHREIVARAAADERDAAPATS